MTSPRPTKTTSADHGTQLGPATRALTGVFRIVRLPFTLLRRFAEWTAASRWRTVILCAAVACTALGILALTAPPVALTVLEFLVGIAAVGAVTVAVGGAVYLLERLCRLIGELVVTLARRLVSIVRRFRDWCMRPVRRIAHSIGVAFIRSRFDATKFATRDAGSPAGAAVPASTTTTHNVPFDAAVYQNKYLPRNGTEVHAIVEVTAHESCATTGDAPEAAEVILLDCSGSMGQPWSKLRAARQATEAAIDSLRPGTWFAIVRASHTAEPVYPVGGGLVQVSSATRSAAKRALRLVWPEGGTALGQWLMLARELFASRPGAIAHAILLTDGKNENESRAELETALAACAGQFQCDCRGVGTDWDVGELRTISSRLLGTVDIVPDPSGLAADFRAMTEAAMAKAVTGATLEVWTPGGATLRYVKQVTPEIRDLTPARIHVDDRTGAYPTGAWGNESREYHICVEVEARQVGEEILASRVSLLVGGRAVSTALVKAVWTDDEQLATEVNRRVAHSTGQVELADAIQQGLDARAVGDEEAATTQLGRAVQLASEGGNDATLQLLGAVVDIEDQTSGTVRLKHDVDDVDEMALDTRSVKTVRADQLASEAS